MRQPGGASTGPPSVELSPLKLYPSTLWVLGNHQQGAAGGVMTPSVMSALGCLAGWEGPCLHNS